MASTIDEDSPRRSTGISQPGGSENSDAGVSTFERSSVLDNATAGADPTSTDDSESSSPELSRPNRWLGSASTYNDWIQPERALLKSLGRQRADDLSIHLYNAHALKARVRDPDVATSNLKSYHAKKRWIKRNEDRSLPWCPKDAWTSWPLSTEDVPRERERFGVPIKDLIDASHDGPTYRLREAWRPGKEMEDVVLALMLKQGHEKWRGRQVNDEKLEKTPPAESDDDSNVAMKLESGNEADYILDVEDVLANQYIEPAFLADDDEASRVLDPMVQHIMAKLDDLLRGLHKSNEGRQPSTHSTYRSRSRHRDSRSSSRPVVPRPKSRVQSLTEDDLEDNEDGNEADSNGDQGAAAVSNTIEDEPATQPTRKRKHPLNPRDWSEVLAIASLTGWDSNVVQRAAHRCANLFGETVGFGLLGDPAVAKPALVIEQDHQDNVEGFSVKEESPQPTKWRYCPVDTCKRKNEPFREAWRWREHLKRVHKYDHAAIARVESAMGMAVVRNPSNPVAHDE